MNYRRKADQEWEMAGLARQDRDLAAVQRHTERARAYERGEDPDTKEMEMKLPEDQIVCVICREIIHKTESKRCVISVDWGSFSGTPHYGQCCEKHETDSQGYIVGRAYA